MEQQPHNLSNQIAVGIVKGALAIVAAAIGLIFLWGMIERACTDYIHG